MENTAAERVEEILKKSGFPENEVQCLCEDLRILSIASARNRRLVTYLLGQLRRIAADQGSGKKSEEFAVDGILVATGQKSLPPEDTWWPYIPPIE